MGGRRSVTVRILVRIDDHGEWDAEGVSGFTDKRMRNLMDEHWEHLSGRAESEVWVTAEVEVPAKKRRRAVRGRVG